MEYHASIEDEWRWASVDDVKAHRTSVEAVLCDNTWYICALMDGKVAGPGYQYEVQYGGHDDDLGHKLIMKGI